MTKAEIAPSEDAASVTSIATLGHSFSLDLLLAVIFTRLLRAGLPAAHHKTEPRFKSFNYHEL